MYGYIYEIVNLTNGKKYIGQHKASEFDEDYHGSGKILKQSIQKNGWDGNYTCSILTSVNDVPTICESELELNSSEEYYIDYYNCVESNDYYNLKPGGLGKSVTGCVYIKKDGCPCHKVLPEELDFWINVMGYSLGGPTPTAEVVAKRAQSNTGKKRSPETGKKISAAKKGKPQSPEQIRKAIETKKKLGKPNWRKGLITVIKDDIQRSIREEELDDYLKQGFVRGAKKHSPESHEKHSAVFKQTVYMKKGDIRKRPKTEDADMYLAEGFMIVGDISIQRYNDYKANERKTS